MGYCDADDVKAEFKELDTSTDDAALTDDTIDSWITQADGLIDTYLAIRYMLPIPASAKQAKQLLKMICSMIVTQRVRDKLEVKQVRVEGKQEVRTNSRKEAIKMLEDISTGVLTLIDVPLATSAAGVTSYVSSNSYERTFKRGQDQY